MEGGGGREKRSSFHHHTDCMALSIKGKNADFHGYPFETPELAREHPIPQGDRNSRVPAIEIVIHTFSYVISIVVRLSDLESAHILPLLRQRKNMRESAGTIIQWINKNILSFDKTPTVLDERTYRITHTYAIGGDMGDDATRDLIARVRCRIR